jgi:hypothetical protein
MSLLVLMFAVLISPPAEPAQSPQAAAVVGQPSASADGAQPQETTNGQTTSSNLPVSLHRIREALERPAPALLKGIDKQPDFSVQIRERQKIEALLATLDFKSGPAPPGGLYGFEQQRLAMPAVDNPLAQPYAAFSQGELLTILVENLAGKYLAGRAANAITSAQRADAEAAARRDVESAVAAYCAASPPPSAAQLCSASRIQ